MTPGRRAALVLPSLSGDVMHSCAHADLAGHPLADGI